MEFRLIPLTIIFKYKLQYSFYILGYHFGTRTVGLGFSLFSMNQPDCKEWWLTLSFWNRIIRFKVKTIWDSYSLKCKECGNSVWKHNLYCPGCCDDVFYEDTEKIELNKPNK